MDPLGDHASSQSSSSLPSCSVTAPAPPVEQMPSRPNRDQHEAGASAAAAAAAALIVDRKRDSSPPGRNASPSGSGSGGSSTSGGTASSSSTSSSTISTAVQPAEWSSSTSNPSPFHLQQQQYHHPLVPPPKRQRNRQQLSCVSCHIRKQACDKVVPCSRCIKRGVAHECRIEGRNNPPARNLANDVPGPSSTTSSPLTSSESSSSATYKAANLTERVKVLEAALRQTSLPSPSPPIAFSSSSAGSHGLDPTADYEAAKALGQLGRVDSPAAPHLNSDLSSSHHTHSSSPSSVGLSLHSQVNEYKPQSISAGTGSASLQHPQHPVDPQVAELVAALPPRVLCDCLVNIFFGQGVQSLLHDYFCTRRDLFEQDYRRVLDWRDSLQSSSFVTMPPTSLSFLAMVNIVLAMALQFLPDSDLPFINRFTPDHRVLEASLRIHSKKATELSEAEELPDLSYIEATFLQAIYFNNCGRASASYALAASAIRSAQSMGLHRDAFADPNLPSYETEKRRKVWWCLYKYDRVSNYAFGRPYIIHDDFCDVKLPANADLHKRDPLDASPIISLPLTEYTSSSIQIFSIQLSRICGLVTERLYSAKPYSYHDVMEMDEKFVAFESSLPAWYRSSAQDAVAPADFQRLIDTAQLGTSILWLRNVMHRSYLLRKLPANSLPDPTATSRSLSINLSQRLIGSCRLVLLSLSREQKRFFFVPFQMFEGASTLAIASLQNSASQSLVENNDAWMVVARDALALMGEDNVVAAEAVRCLDALRQRIASIGPPNFQFRAQLSTGPSTPTTGSAMPLLNHVQQAPTPQQSPGLSAGGFTFGNASYPMTSLATPHTSSAGSTSPLGRAELPMHATDSPGQFEWWCRPKNMIWPLGIECLEHLQIGNWEPFIHQLDQILGPRLIAPR